MPVRNDVADFLIAQNLTVLRYGGNMVNAPEYRWKKMIGPRYRRPPYKGTWYPYSKNGWGIVDFLDFCEKAGFLAVPAFNMGETPKDMADFIECVNSAADSLWGQKRTDGGHFEGSPVTSSLPTHQKVRAFAKSNSRPVWFDVHIANNEPMSPN